MPLNKGSEIEDDINPKQRGKMDVLSTPVYILRISWLRHSFSYGVQGVDEEQGRKIWE